MYLYHVNIFKMDIPNTVRVTFAEIMPAVFFAVQLYTPISSGFTSMMKNTSSSGITRMRRSRAAGKSVPPSFCHATWGVGCPSAAHSNRAFVPVRIVMSRGVLTNEGSTVHISRQREISPSKDYSHNAASSAPNKPSIHSCD